MKKSRAVYEPNYSYSGDHVNPGWFLVWTDAQKRRENYSQAEESRVKNRIMQVKSTN